MRRSPFDNPWERRHPCLTAFGERAFHHSRPIGKAGREGCLRSQGSANAGRRGRLRTQGAVTPLFILLCGLHTLTLAQVRFTRGELERPSRRSSNPRTARRFTLTPGSTAIR